MDLVKTVKHDLSAIHGNQVAMTRPLVLQLVHLLMKHFEFLILSSLIRRCRNKSGVSMAIFKVDLEEFITLVSGHAGGGDGEHLGRNEQEIVHLISKVRALFPRSKPHDRKLPHTCSYDDTRSFFNVFLLIVLRPIISGSFTLKIRSVTIVYDRYSVGFPRQSTVVIRLVGKRRDLGRIRWFTPIYCRNMARNSAGTIVSVRLRRS